MNRQLITTNCDYKPVLGRFIPLDVNGDTLPLGCGLSSLKLFSMASSLSCCLLYMSSESSCNTNHDKKVIKVQKTDGIQLKIELITFYDLEDNYERTSNR